MARRAAIGFELTSPEDGSQLAHSNGRLPGGYCMTLAHKAADGTDHRSTVNGTMGGLLHFYVRLYMRIRATPGANEVRFIGGFGALAGIDAAWYLTIGSDRKIRAYAKGNGARQAMGTGATALNLNQWYRINAEVTFNTPAGRIVVNGVKIDGTLDLTGTPVNIGNESFGASTVEWGGGTERDGGVIDLDDLVVDDSTEPGAGGITLLHVTGQGTYNAWTALNDYRAVMKRMPGGAVTTPTSVPSVQNATTSAATTYTLETLASKGLSAVTIKSTRAIGFGTLARATSKYRIRKNGVDFDSAGFGPNTQVYLAANIGADAAARGWLQDVSTFAVAPTDTLEVGIVDGPAGAGTSALTGMYLVVDWEGADPAALSEYGDLAAAVVSYTGNGTQQDVAFADLTFEPTLLIVIGENTGTQQRVIWHRGMGWSGDNARCLLNQDVVDVGLARVRPGSFSVYGAANSLNTNAVKFWAFALRDTQMRMTAYGLRGLCSAGTPIDNIDVNLDKAALGSTAQLATFQVDALFATLLRWTAVTVASKAFYRDLNYTGDAATKLDATGAPIADGIQSQGVGTFQLGTLPTQGSGFSTEYLAISQLASIFNAVPLVEVLTYTGNGGGARTVPFTRLTTTTPALMLVLTEAVAEHFYRFFNDGNGTASRSVIAGSSSATAITDFSSIGQFTVGATLNANTVKYHVIAFGVGTDPIIPPEVTLTNTVAIGLTWVEVLDALLTTRVWAKVALPDPGTYYGGYKEDRIIKWGVIRRALSDHQGEYEASDWDFIASDWDRLQRTLLAGDSTKYFTNRPIVCRMISDADRRLQKRPRTIFKGVVSRYKPLSPLHFQWFVQDPFATKFSATDTEAQIPQRLITIADFPNASGTLQTDNGEHDIAAVGLPVPIIYGEISDTKVITIPSTGPQLPPLDPTLGRPTIVGQLGLAGGDLGARNSYVAAGRAGMIGPLSNEGGNAYHGDGYDPSGCQVVFTRVTGADIYYIFVFGGIDGHNPTPCPAFNPYGDKAGAQRATMVTHSATLFDGYADLGGDHVAFVFGWNDAGSVDLLAGSSTTSSDAGKGQCPSVYVGKRTIGGVDYHSFLLAGHALKSIDEIYINDAPLNLQTDATVAGVGGVWLVPGYAAYNAAFATTNKYEDINGHRYSIVYGKVGAFGPETGAGAKGQNGVALAFSVKGIESVGDGTGTLITDLLLQYRHALQNWILGNYQTGAWLASPTFTDEPDVSMVDDASFDEASAVAQTRVAGGYRGDFIIGWTSTSAAQGRDPASGRFTGVGSRIGGERITLRELIARFNVSADVNSGFNRKSQFFVSMETPSVSEITGATKLSDVLDIFEDSLDVTDDFDNQFTVVPYRHTLDMFGREKDGWLSVRSGVLEVSDAVSIAAYATAGIPFKKTAPTRNLYMVRGGNTVNDPAFMAQGYLAASDVAQRYLMRHKDPPRVVTLQTGMAGMNIDLGDTILVTHYGGIGAIGWVDRPLRVMRHEADPDQFSVSLEGYDMQSFFNEAFIFGDEGALPGTWASATAAQRRYGYLADDTTGLFSDGARGKRVR